MEINQKKPSVLPKPADKVNPVNVVEIKNLKKSFGNNNVLKNFNLTLAKEENLVVLGKSGSGKSVLIKCIVGLIEPDDGTLLVLEKNITELQEKDLNNIRKKIGFL